MENCKTWVEINKENLLNNVAQFRERIGVGVKLSVAVKANAYGHGMKEVATVIDPVVDFFCVDSIDEALELKVVATKPILILGYTLFSRLEEVVANGFHQVVANIETLEKLSEISKNKNREAFVHLKIETGTSRQGIWLNDLENFLNVFKGNSLLKLAGVSTHFANIEDTTDDFYSKLQRETYKKAVMFIELRGFQKFIKHTACSAAAVLFPETYFDMIRLGIGLYGLWSSTETQVVAAEKNIKIQLKPVLTWKTRVAHIKTLPAGTPVSYGCTEKVSMPTKVAVLPVGYYDGYDRGLSSLGNVIIKDERCKILGRVCMNMCVVDVNHIENLNLEDEVILLGRGVSENVSAEEMAKKINTINYEVVTRINSVIKRFVVD
jgi:alanine racemase